MGNSLLPDRGRYVRKVGDVLHPQWESREALAEIRKTIGEYNFAGQYQQSPAPPVVPAPMGPGSRSTIARATGLSKAGACSALANRPAVLAGPTRTTNVRMINRWLFDHYT